ncbi:MAG: hypothetical protein ACK2US_11105 [Anaerolineae bacterium]|jgi:hypothetical protein
MVKGLFLCAGLIAVVFLVCHVAGFREYTSVLSGTYTGMGSAASGLLYAVASLAFVIVAPILAIDAGGLFLLNLACAALGRRQGQKRAGVTGEGYA